MKDSQDYRITKEMLSNKDLQIGYRSKIVFLKTIAVIVWQRKLQTADGNLTGN